MLTQRMMVRNHSNNYCLHAMLMPRMSTELIQFTSTCEQLFGRKLGPTGDGGCFTTEPKARISPCVVGGTPRQGESAIHRSSIASGEGGEWPHLHTSGPAPGSKGAANPASINYLFLTFIHRDA